MSNRPPSPLEVVMTINAAESRLRQAMLGSDIDVLADLLADDLLFVGPQGQVLTKTADLDTHRSGQLQLTRIDFSETEIRPLGDTAVVLTRASLAGSYMGATFAGDFRYLRVWRNGSAGWQVAAGQCTAIS
ncbi:MAG TPA: nuclear transport factor 2 family protein [Terriglobales bacterium]|nr:nuclear transport factor 2 family protein [Terriglobales bacterium]